MRLIFESLKSCFPGKKEYEVHADLAWLQRLLENSSLATGSHNCCRMAVSADWQITAEHMGLEFYVSHQRCVGEKLVC